MDDEDGVEVGLCFFWVGDFRAAYLLVRCPLCDRYAFVMSSLDFSWPFLWSRGWSVARDGRFWPASKRRTRRVLTGEFTLRSTPLFVQSAAQEAAYLTVGRSDVCPGKCGIVLLGPPPSVSSMISVFRRSGLFECGPARGVRPRGRYLFFAVLLIQCCRDAGCIFQQFARRQVIVCQDYALILFVHAPSSRNMTRCSDPRDLFFLFR